MAIRTAAGILSGIVARALACASVARTLVCACGVTPNRIVARTLVCACVASLRRADQSPRHGLVTSALENRTLSNAKYFLYTKSPTLADAGGDLLHYLASIRLIAALCVGTDRRDPQIA